MRGIVDVSLRDKVSLMQRAVYKVLLSEKRDWRMFCRHALPGRRRSPNDRYQQGS